MPGPTWTMISLLLLPHIAETKGAHNLTQPLVEMGSWELFAQAGLEPQYSWSLPPKKLGLQTWSTMPGFINILNCKVCKRSNKSQNFKVVMNVAMSRYEISVYVTHFTMTLAAVLLFLVCFVFQIRSHANFAQSGLTLQSFCLSLQSSWDYKVYATTPSPLLPAFLKNLIMSDRG
jgi:hypothetical protein